MATATAKNHFLAFRLAVRQVSAIIDVDLVPETCRRVKLLKHGSDKPLGFYIRDGTSVRVTPQGLEKVPGIFISRYKILRPFLGPLGREYFSLN